MLKGFSRRWLDEPVQSSSPLVGVAIYTDRVTILAAPVSTALLSLYRQVTVHGRLVAAAWYYCHLAKLEIAKWVPVSIRTEGVKYCLSVILAEPRLSL